MLDSLDRGRASGSRKVGTVVHGMGGIGKTWLAGRVVDQLADDYRPVVLHDYLDETSLFDAISTDIELETVLEACPATLPFKSRMARFLKSVAKEPYEVGKPNLLFVIDEFEWNYRPVGAAGTAFTSDHAIAFENGAPKLRPVAASVLRDLVDAVAQSDVVHQILITTRYIPDLDCMRDFAVLQLLPLPPKDVDRMVADLAGRVRIPEALVADIRDVAGGNPWVLDRLFSWADEGVAVNVHTLRARLEDQQRTVFLEERIAAETLLTSRTDAELALLRAALPFRSFVTIDVLSELMDISRGDELDLGDAAATIADHVARLAQLTLMETDVRPGGQIGFRVPRALLFHQLLRNEDSQASAHCARALATSLGDFRREPDARRLDRELLRELHRLAVAGDVRELAVEATMALAYIEHWNFRNDAMAQLCRHELARYPDYRLHRALALSEMELGLVKSARNHYAEALRTCPPDTPEDRAQILIEQALFNREDMWSSEYAQQVEEAWQIIQHSDYAPLRLHGLWGRAVVLSCQGGTDQTEAARIFEEALELARTIPDGGVRMALTLIGRARLIYNQESDFERALADEQTALGWYERNGLVSHQADALLALAQTCGHWGRLDQAEEWLKRAEQRNAVAKSLQLRRNITLERGCLMLGRDDLSNAEDFFRKALEISRDTEVVIDQARALDGLSSVHRRRGESTRADEAMLSARELWRQLESPSAQVMALLNSVNADLRESEDPDDAAKALGRALEAAELARAADLPDYEVAAWGAYTRLADGVAVAAEDLEPALRRLAVLQRAAEDRAGEAATLTRLGSLLLAGSPSAASEPLGRALTLYEESGLVSQQAHAHTQLAAVRTALDDSQEAAEHWLKAVVLYAGVEDWNSAALSLREAAQSVRQITHSTAVSERALLLALSWGRKASSPDIETQVLRDLADIARSEGRTSVAERRGTDAEHIERRSEALQVLIGEHLVPLVDPARGADFISEIGRLRAELEAREQLLLPGVRLKEAADLPPRDYAVYIWGELVHQGTIPADAAGRIPVGMERIGTGLDDPAAALLSEFTAVVRSRQTDVTLPGPPPRPDIPEDHAPPSLDEVLAEVAVIEPVTGRKGPNLAHGLSEIARRLITDISGRRFKKN
ncbi:hypothetical protein [Streptomyces sp. NPDC053542]|uniref:hypothetical protein n=1 Tax=Streptomyces sp. NPDC053542 TaxID=3365710 RepID=UPI0037CDB2B4